MRNDHPPSLHDDNYERGPRNDDDHLGNLNMNDLRRRLIRMEEEKRLSRPRAREKSTQS